MYFDYIGERIEGCELIQDEYSFVLYQINYEEKHIYIRDMYVKPEHRYDKIATTLVDRLVDLAREEKLRYVTATVEVAAKNTEDSLMAALSYGFKITGAGGNVLYIAKEI